MTMLNKAPKKHQTEVRYCVKNIMVTKHDKDINIPRIYARLTVEIKSGALDAIK